MIYFLRKGRGYILISTLLMIMIMSLLILSRLQALLLYSKLSSRYTVYHQEFYQLESQARLLTSKPISEIRSGCYRKMDEANEVVSLLKKKKGCSFHQGSVSYQFYIEDLGIEPCLPIIKNMHSYSSHHWRYSLGFYKDEELQSVLQLRVLKPESKGKCLFEKKKVQAGISSWRYYAEMESVKVT